MVTTTQLEALQQDCRRSYVDPALMQYAVKLVAATREPARFGLGELAGYISFGASPRATIALVECGRALAFLRGRAYVLPQDIVDIAPDVLRHRLSLSYEALADATGADAIVQRILQRVPQPARPLQDQWQKAANE